MIASELQGTCSDRFASLRSALDANVRSGEELGASLVVDIEGETVVDLWGGFRDASRSQPWTADTIVNVWSTTKTVTNLAALLLVDRGELDVHAPVARYWPEFGGQGKEGIEVRHVLAHTSGVSGWEPPFAVEDMYDWEKSTTHLAAQSPWWVAGTASGYHAQNQGHIVGELVRRVTGSTLKEFVAAEIADPLGADFQIGAREQDWPRVAEIVPPPPLAIDLGDPDGVAYKTLTSPLLDASSANTDAWRRADMGATNGHGNARSVARIMRCVTLGGESGGVRLLSPDTIDLIFQEQISGIDLVLGLPLRWGIGYGLPHPDTVPYLPDDRICFWGGWGGSMIIMDLDRRMTVSYMMNRMAPGVIGSTHSEAYLRAVYDAVG
jgi:CubicO group peptidase (beta-lactamase class C family)